MGPKALWAPENPLTFGPISNLLVNDIINYSVVIIFLLSFDCRQAFWSDRIYCYNPLGKDTAVLHFNSLAVTFYEYWQ